MQYNMTKDRGALWYELIDKYVFMQSQNPYKMWI
jgi:hypothetical protein